MQATPLYIVSVAARTLARSLTSKLDQYHKIHDAHLLYYTTATTTTYALKLTSMLCHCHEEKKEGERTCCLGLYCLFIPHPCTDTKKVVFIKSHGVRR